MSISKSFSIKINNKGKQTMFGLSFFDENPSLEVDAEGETNTLADCLFQHIDFFSLSYVDKKSIEVDIEKMEELILQGANVNQQLNSVGGRALLHQAVTIDSVEAIRLLVTYKADVNRRDISGKTPLHYAAEQGRTEIFETLLELGADPDSKDTYGACPLDLVRDNDMKQNVEAMIEQARSDKAANSAQTPSPPNMGCFLQSVRFCPPSVMSLTRR